MLNEHLDNNLSEISAEMLLNYLYPDLADRWIVQAEGTFYRNYNSDLLAYDDEAAVVQLSRDSFNQLLPQGLLYRSVERGKVNSEKLMARGEEFLAYMEKLKGEKDFDLVMLMITDVLREGTELLYVGSDDTIQQAFSVTTKANRVFLPGVMSRKKQIIPMLTALWG